MESSAAPAAPNVSLSAIGQIGLTVSDIGRSIVFYRDTLGMKLLFQAGSMGFFDCGGIRLMLSPPEGAREAYSSVIYFKVADIQGTYRVLLERGVSFEGPPHLIARMPSHDLWMVFFRDPDRNLLSLMAEVPVAAT